jgi:hypothetical protein
MLCLTAAGGRRGAARRQHAGASAPLGGQASAAPGAVSMCVTRLSVLKLGQSTVGGRLATTQSWLWLSGTSFSRINSPAVADGSLNNKQHWHFP